MIRILAAAGIALFSVLATPAVHRISESGFGAYEASLAPMGSGFVAAWYDTRHGHGEIYARALDAEGTPLGPELRLTHGPDNAYEADVAAHGDTMVVAWYEQQTPRTYRTMAGAWSKDGVALWRRQLSVRSGKNALVRLRGTDIFCAWLERSEDGTPVVRAQWLDRTGQPKTEAMTVAQAGRTTWALTAALDDRGIAWIVFDAEAGTRADEVFLARVDKSAASVVRLTDDDGKRSKYPDLTLHRGRAALTWQDERDGNEEVYLLVGSLASLRGPIDARGTRVTRTPGASIGAYNAWSGDSLGVAWCDDTAGQHEIYFESFDVNGRPTTTAVRVTDNPTQSMIPAIQAAGGGFALVWNEVAPGPAGGHDPRSRSEIVFTRMKN
jgi:hypothetical protein